MKHLLIGSIVSITLVSWAQGTKTVAPTGGSPSQTCKQLVDAAKANNYERASELMLMPRHMMHHQKDMMGKAGTRPQQKFEKMHQEHLTEIQNINCGQEQIAGDRAIVTATSNNEKRFIPFVQQEGSWKFDMHTYRSFYMMDDKKEMKSKAM